MIKICEFEFEPVPCEEGKSPFINFAKFGNCTMADCRFFDDVDSFTARLPEDIWAIGFDQSTSNCGIIIKNLNNTRAVMIEKKRAKGEDADTFMFGLERMVHKLCEGSTFTHLLYEKPIEGDSFRSAQVLFQLEGYIRGLALRYHEFSSAKLDSVENSSWRKNVICDQFNGKDRKLASYLSIKSIYPWTAGYGESIGKDQDVYEAMGVMFGWFMASYDPFGRPYVRGEKFNGNMAGYILPNIGADDVASQLELAGLKVYWCVENPAKSVYENIASAVSKDRIVCVELTDPYSMLCLSIESNIKWEGCDKMTMIVVAPNFVDTRLYKITGNKFHFVL